MTTATNPCIFCGIARDSANSDVVYRDDRCFVVKDINPKAPVHLLIIPNMHIASLAYVGPAQVPIMGHLFIVAEEMARRENITLSGYRLVLNQGPDAQQTIAHPHIHLMGGKRLGDMG